MKSPHFGMTSPVTLIDDRSPHVKPILKINIYCCSKLEMSYRNAIEDPDRRSR